MPIKSYIVFPQPGKKDELIDTLSTIENCEVLPADNKDILVLVTDTIGAEEEEHLRVTIDNIEEIDHLTLVSGFSDNISESTDKETHYDE